MRSLRNVEEIDTGYDTGRLAYAEVFPDMSFSKRDAAAYRTIGAILPQVAERISHVPGVTATALATRAPLRDIVILPIFLPGVDSTPTLGRSPPIAHIVSPGFFGVMRHADAVTARSCARPMRRGRSRWSS